MENENDLMLKLLEAREKLITGPPFVQIGGVCPIVSEWMAEFLVHLETAQVRIQQ